ncbi:hypothetical protein GEU84_003330 [Fertoebacter nigrum]|uniref:Uncharacterized protein n=1 Tax=Fertoeibacter niger TaxID=2656921 RepID=A0A8X8GXT8_9RHOB|nr:hypothetical protein [Fertoeibacter niger]NUB43406.1 hypothetical protein [Fertoeibacter niger]
MAVLTTKVTPLIAEQMADKNYSYQSIWKHLKSGPEQAKPLTWACNTLGFEYDPADDTFAVYVTWSDAEAVKLKTPDFLKELAKNARGAPQC